MKTCLFCAEEIKEEAKKCKHCGEYQDTSLVQDDSTLKDLPKVENKNSFGYAFKKHPIIMWSAVIMFVVLFLGQLFIN